MSYTVKLYYNTGFNGLNVPIDAGLLDTDPDITNSGNDIPALNINQGGFLSKIAIRASWHDVMGADYLRLSNSGEKWYYTINGISMTSEDVALLSVTLDPWTTVDGKDTITGFLDGIVERHHVSTGEDNFGAYCEQDPYLIPSKPLELVMGARVPMPLGSTIVESTVDLKSMATVTNGLEYTATNSVSTDPGTCTVPEVEIPANGDQTTIRLIGVGAFTTPSSQYYLYGNADVREGIKRARSLGVEGSILNCWKIPDGSSITQNAGVITEIEREFQYQNTNLDFIFDSNVRNKRVLYGDLCKYIILSIASGNKASFNPEDIYHSGDSFPRVKYICDPRPNGTPHFRFEYFLGDTTNFWDNCIQGLPNPSAPLVYRDKSGSEVDKAVFNSEMSVRRSDATVAAKKADLNMMLSPVENIGPNIGAFVGSTLKAGIGLNDMYSAKRGLETLENLSITTESIDISRQFENQRLKELQTFNISQNIVVPDINFPRSETLRDFVGNGCCTYRLKPSALDIAKFDKILTMYGYRDTTAPDVSMFQKRSKFSYIRVIGASFEFGSNYTIPMWLRDALAAQFASGLRIWKHKPDVSAYTDGSNT